MKTAMEEMFDFIAAIKKDLETKKFTADKMKILVLDAALAPIDEIIKKHASFMTKERQQIISAWKYGTDSEAGNNRITNGDDYYTSTYKLNQ